jgi:hypothetical protein
MLTKIPQNRLLLYLIIIGLIPIALVLFTFFSDLSRIDSLKSSLDNVEQMAAIREKKQAVNMAVKNSFRDADHFYIDKYLETLTFLEPEIESLQKIASNKSFPEDETVKKRFEFLTGSSNSLVFSEGVVQSYPFFQETLETLVHPVEVNVNDIKEILTKVEGTPIGSFTPGPNRPQLVILDFKLDKKKITDKNEVYLLNMKLLKREFL